MHVELNRKFRQLTEDPAASGSDQVPLLPSIGSRDWDGLLEHHRVVILSEAGAGKTAEIRQVARRIRSQGKPAFFLRLENLPQNFDEAFEEGSIEEFDEWLASAADGWFLLDSIDEARLKSVRDFETALGVFARRIKPALPRAHIVLTGRTAAWRPYSDLALCGLKLPYAEPSKRQAGTSADGTLQSSRTNKPDHRPEGTDSYKLYALEDLTAEQVRHYAQARGIQDVDRMLREVERSDGWAFTTRPLDLEDLLKYWQTHRRIGSKLELLRSSLQRRLQETTQNRRETTPLSPKRAHDGARRIAAACTLARKQTISVPDGPHGHSGLQVDVVLADWSAAEVTALLQRAIFDEEIYGTVRFHHREVREYLTAEWMAEHLKDPLARPAIEDLLFKTKYNLLVVNPTTRPVLPWLAHLDPPIQRRALGLAAVTLLNEGDPGDLPLHVRRGALAKRCADLAKGAPREFADHASIQRFAKDDLTPDIRAMLSQYPDDENQNFLLRIIWQGELRGALPDVLAIARAAETAHYPLIFAIRALEAIAPPADLADLRSHFAHTVADPHRDVINALLSRAPKTRETLEWLLRCLEKVGPPGEFSVDNLRSGIASFFEGLGADDCAWALAEFCRLLDQKPFAREDRHDISERYVWLLGPSACAMQTLLLERHPCCLEAPALSVLARLPIATTYDLFTASSKTPELAPLVQDWTELLFALLWHLVDRARFQSRPADRNITTYWQAQTFQSYVQFRPEHFERALSDVVSRPLLDDKLIALSVAIQAFNMAGRLQAQEVALRAACAAQPAAVTQRLEEAFVHPEMNAVVRRNNRMSALHAARAKREAAKAAQALEESRSWLMQHLEQIRGPFIPGQPDRVGALIYLYEQMHAAESNSSIWGAANWQSLIPRFGRDIAEAYRDGLRNYWRRHRPQLVSEGAAVNSTPRTDIIGLGGLYIEYDENPDWATAFSGDDIDLAFRYAMRELNGVPAWFQSLHAAAPETVRDLLLREIDFELALPATTVSFNYVLNDVLWSAPWSWDMLSPMLLERLQHGDIVEETRLQALLDIVQGSTINDSALRLVAQAKCDLTLPAPALARWFAVWTGVNPAPAIAALQVHCETLDTDAARTEFFMQYLATLVGGRHGQPSRCRRAYEAAGHLKTLYLLAHQCVRIEEDIDRADKGVYSPGLRDDAQDAREKLLSILRAQTGKEAFKALTDIAQHHPDPSHRPYIENYARQVAEADCAGDPWSESQVSEFHDHLECTPANPRELLDLAFRSLETLRVNLEEGDSSIAVILRTVDQEVLMRNYIADWLRPRAQGRYSVTQEEEFADAKRSDIRFLGQGFDAPIPVELKLADNNWSGNKLFERLKNQLSGDYLRDIHSRFGIFLLVYRGDKTGWVLPHGGASVDFAELVEALRSYGEQLALASNDIDELRVIGIDLTKRTA